MNEGGELMKSEITTLTEKPSVEKVIESRFKQTRTERMVEYLTGLKIDNPKLVDKLESDQKEIRTKYGLPKRDERFTDPNGYETKLRGLAEKIGVEIKDKSNYKNFFEKSMLAGAFYDDKEKIVVVDINKTDEREYTKGLGNLEHEMIHALQDKYYPEMDVEHQEYEAYVAAWNMDYLRENDYAVGINFDLAVGGSINHWYRTENEETGKNLKPEWNSPEYFLKKVDGVSSEKIESYKNEHISDVEK